MRLQGFRIIQFFCIALTLTCAVAASAETLNCTSSGIIPNFTIEYTRQDCFWGFFHSAVRGKLIAALPLRSDRADEASQVELQGSFELDEQGMPVSFKSDSDQSLVYDGIPSTHFSVNIDPISPGQLQLAYVNNIDSTIADSFVETIACQ